MVYTTGIVKKGLSIPRKPLILLTYRLNGILGIVFLYRQTEIRLNISSLYSLIENTYIGVTTPTIPTGFKRKPGAALIGFWHYATYYTTYSTIKNS